MTNIKDEIGADIKHEVTMDDEQFERLTGMEMTDEQWVKFDAEINRRCENAVTRVMHTVARKACDFSGDACDFGEWIQDDLKEKA